MGAGSFAQKFLLPGASKQAAMIGVATASGNNARNVADKYGFAYATGDSQDLLTDDDINTIFIATRHNLHAEQVLAALQSGKNVFVEKPLCLTTDELEQIAEAYRQGSARLMVGFNRRFAPLLQKIKTALPAGIPLAMNYRINAGAIPADSWIQDADLGGGRIIGEVCHFVDLALFLAGSPIAQLDSQIMKTASGLNDTLVVALAFENGSVANISYFANGAKSLSKERLEVHCAGKSWLLDDFKSLSTFGGSRKKSTSGRQDKGHAREVELFLQAVSDGSPAPISFEDIYQVTAATLSIVNKVQLETVATPPVNSESDDHNSATTGE
jgi:polar amino acid transport system substrate-binding protein